jgi:hypothetical protein
LSRVYPRHARRALKTSAGLAKMAASSSLRMLDKVHVPVSVLHG